MGVVFRDMTKREATRFMSGDKGKHRSRKWLAEKVSTSFVCDIGCGKGVAVNDLFDPAYYLGIDISEELIKIAKRNNPRHSFFCCDCANILLSDNSVDYSIVRSVLEHTDSINEALSIYKEAIRIASVSTYISWHTPPKGTTNNMISVQAEFDDPMPQNKYAEIPFLLPDIDITKFYIEESEIWSVRKFY